MVKTEDSNHVNIYTKSLSRDYISGVDFCLRPLDSIFRDQ